MQSAATSPCALSDSEDTSSTIGSDDKNEWNWFKDDESDTDFFGDEQVFMTDMPVKELEENFMLHMHIWAMIS